MSSHNCNSRCFSGPLHNSANFLPSSVTSLIAFQPRDNATVRFNFGRSRTKLHTQAPVINSWIIQPAKGLFNATGNSVSWLLNSTFLHIPNGSLKQSLLLFGAYQFLQFLTNTTGKSLSLRRIPLKISVIETFLNGNSLIFTCLFCRISAIASTIEAISPVALRIAIASSGNARSAIRSEYSRIRRIDFSPLKHRI